MTDDDDTPKKGKRGPPSRGGRGEQVRIPPDALDDIDRYAERHGIDRQEAIRRLARKGRE